MARRRDGRHEFGLGRSRKSVVVAGMTIASDVHVSTTADEIWSVRLILCWTGRYPLEQVIQFCDTSENNALMSIGVFRKLSQKLHGVLQLVRQADEWMASGGVRHAGA